MLARTSGVKRKINENEDSHQLIAQGLGIVNPPAAKKPRILPPANENKAPGPVEQTAKLIQPYRYIDGKIIYFSDRIATEIRLKNDASKEKSFRGLLAWDIDNTLINYEQSKMAQKCFYNSLENINSLNQFAFENGYLIVIITARKYESGKMVNQHYLSALNILRGLNQEHFSYLYFVGDHKTKTIDEVGIADKNNVLNFLREELKLDANFPSILIDDQIGHIKECKQDGHFGVHVAGGGCIKHFEQARQIIKGECDLNPKTNETKPEQLKSPSRMSP